MYTYEYERVFNTGLQTFIQNPESHKAQKTNFLLATEAHST